MLACSKVLTSTQLCALVRAAQLPHGLLLCSSRQNAVYAPLLEACISCGGINKASFHTGATAAAVDNKQHPAISAEEQSKQQTSSSSTLTEEELSKLFDNELQQRLLSAAAAARQASQHAQETPGGTTNPSSSLQRQGQQQQQQQQTGALDHPVASPTSTSGITSSGPTSSGTWTPQQAARAWQQTVAPTWNPLVSADPWAPLPTPAASRQRLPQQVLQLLRQAGVPQETAQEALELASSVPMTSAGSISSSSSSNGSGGGSAEGSSREDTLVDKASNAPSSSSSNRSSSSTSSGGSTSSGSSREQSLPDSSCTGNHGGMHGRRLFAQPGASALQQQEQPQQQQQQQQPQQQPQQQQLDVMEQVLQGRLWPVLSRIQTRQLVVLLEECQAPSFGSKQVLLERLVLLLQEQQTSQQQQQQYDQQQQQQQQQVQQHSQEPYEHVQQRAAMPSKQPPDVAAQQQLLRSVLDVQQVGSWLLEARAQDVCIIDVRGRAGMQTHLVIATGLNQQHTRALADAVAWQLQQAAKDLVAQQQLQERKQQQQQQQQQLGVLQEGKGGDDAAGVPQQVEGVLDASVQQQLDSILGATQQQQQQQDEQQPHHSHASSMTPRQLLPPLNVVGDASSDWCLLDAGSVTVHVLTERARRFYAMEGLWGGPQGLYIRWLRQGQARLETKETIGGPRGGSLGL